MRAPGRVNLIGEHTDYSLLPVLPIAIDRAVMVAAAATDDGRVVIESDAVEGVLELDRSRPVAAAGWGRYVLGAAHALERTSPGAGARVLVTSDLPLAGGLSSSSALTCGLLAALSGAWGLPIDRAALAPMAAAAERYAGVETGGMDQEVIVHAVAGNALRIDFLPPSRRLVPVPPGLAFVVASSGEAAPKGEDAREAYNERVVGTRVAAALLADLIGLERGEVRTLGELTGFAELEFLVEELPDSVTPRSAARSLGVLEDSLTSLSHGRVRPDTPLAVCAFARHVLAEAARVDAAEGALLGGDLKRFGQLLDASHLSLRDNFGCSTPALNLLCKSMRKAGALGARLTGAGFGGYALAACLPEVVPAVVAAAVAATGGPAFEVRSSQGLEVLR